MRAKLPKAPGAKQWKPARAGPALTRERENIRLRAMKNLSAKECKTINDNPIDFDLFWDLLGIAAEALNGKRQKINPKFLQSAKQPKGIPDTPECHAWIAVFKECHKRIGEKTDEETQRCQPEPASLPIGQMSPECKEAGELTDRFMVRYMAVWHAFSAGLLKEFDTSKDSSSHVSVRPAVFFAAAVSPLRRDKTFEPKEFIANIRECEQIIKENCQPGDPLYPEKKAGHTRTRPPADGRLATPTRSGGR